MDSPVIVVLGGSSGIGYAVAKQILGAGGAKVIISSSNEKKVQGAVTTLNSENVLGKTCDLMNPTTLEKSIIDLLAFASTFGSIKHIITTAGEIFRPEPIREFKPEVAFEHWSVRYLTILTLAKHAPASLESLTVTTAARSTGAGRSVLDGLVVAVEAVTRSLAVDLAPVRVNCVALGTFDTPITALVTGSAAGQARVKQSLETQLVPRLGTPEEAASAYLYFMQNAFQTGTVLTVDGGRGLK